MPPNQEEGPPDAGKKFDTALFHRRDFVKVGIGAVFGAVGAVFALKEGGSVPTEKDWERARELSRVERQLEMFEQKMWDFIDDKAGLKPNIRVAELLKIATKVRSLQQEEAQKFARVPALRERARKLLKDIEFSIPLIQQGKPVPRPEKSDLVRIV